MNGIPLIGLAVFALSIARPAEAEGTARPANQTLETPCPKWNLAALSPEARKRIHLRAKDVPPFPNEDPRLRDAENWPTAASIGGEVCSLRVQEMDYDVVKTVRSLSEVHPKNGYCLYYQAAPWTVRAPKRGPFYCWWPTPFGKWLTERSSTVQDKHGTTTEIYQYYPSGDLLIHERTYRSSHPVMFFQRERREHLEESFDSSGCLVAWGFWVDNKRVGSYYLGRQVGFEEFGERKVELIRKANADALKSSTK